MKTSDKFILFLIIINITSFFIGLIMLEEHGASILDATLHTYPAIEGLKINFFENLINYGKYGENSYPLHHIIYAYTNPFVPGTLLYKIISCVFSSLIIVFFYLIINIRFKIRRLESLFLSSLILLSPYFRSSAFWGMTENTGHIFLVISFFFFNKYLINNNKFNQIILICLFSSLALYSRVQNIFICIFFYLYFLICGNLKNKIIVTFSYLIFSIPGLILIYLWGGLIDSQYEGELYYFVNISTIPKTLLVILSLIGFYSIPFILILNKKFFILIKDNLNNFIYAFILCLSIFFIFNVNILELDKLKMVPYGQGFVTAIAYKLTKIESSYLFFSAIGILIIHKLYLISYKNKLLILSILSIFSLRVHFFTEYLDPLLFLIFFTILDFEKTKMTLSTRNIIIFEIFFVSILLGAILI
jgi:hypothetical protein